jgi:hypothetical protein
VRMGLTCPERARHRCDNISIPNAHLKIVPIRSWSGQIAVINIDGTRTTRSNVSSPKYRQKGL